MRARPQVLNRLPLRDLRVSRSRFSAARNAASSMCRLRSARCASCPTSSASVSAVRPAPVSLSSQVMCWSHDMPRWGSRHQPQGADARPSSSSCLLLLSPLISSPVRSARSPASALSSVISMRRSTAGLAFGGMPSLCFFIVVRASQAGAPPCGAVFSDRRARGRMESQARSAQGLKRSRGLNRAKRSLLREARGLGRGEWLRNISAECSPSLAAPPLPRLAESCLLRCALRAL